MRYLSYIWKSWRFAFKSLTTTLITLFIILSLFINGALLFSQSISFAIATSIEAVTGVASLATKMKAKNNKLQTKNNQLRKNLNDTNARNKNLFAQLNDTADKNIKLKAKNSKLGKNLNDAKAQNNKLQTKNNQLLKNINDANARNKKLFIQLDNTVDKNIKLKAKNNRLGKNLNDANMSRKKLFTRMDNKLAVDVKAVNTIAGQMAKRVKIGAIRNASSVIFESIPFVGIATIVGVTGWELYDSCQMMKDLNILYEHFGIKIDETNRDQVCGLKIPTKDELRKKHSWWSWRREK